MRINYKIRFIEGTKKVVIPMKMGIQNIRILLDPRFREDDMLDFCMGMTEKSERET
jgi:hypothetical protein